MDVPRLAIRETNAPLVPPEKRAYDHFELSDYIRQVLKRETMFHQ